MEAGTPRACALYLNACSIFGRPYLVWIMVYS